MTDQNEPKDKLDEILDKNLNPPVEGQQQQESSPATEEQAVTPEAVSDTVKTQSTEQQPDTDKGFASHPAWQAREAKLKEAREQLQAEQTKAQQLSKLLDDPTVYSKWLKSQGFSDQQVAQAMRERGMQVPQQRSDAGKEATALSIAEKACKKLNWDISRLNEEQRAYIKDHVDLTMAAVEDYVKTEMDKRMGPMEEMNREYSAQKQMTQEESQVKEISAKEFPNLKWDDIQSAITKYCNELDQKDPQRTLKFTYEDLYYRATRPLLRELEVSKGRQEARDAVKANARPLGAGVTSKTNDAPGKKKSFDDILDGVLDSNGVNR